MNSLFSTVYWLYLSATSIVLYLGAVLICAVTAPFDPNRSLLHRYTCWWGQLYLRCLPGCRLRVEGRDKIVPGRAYVLVANHQSMTDIMALSALGVPFKWVAKKEAFRLPFIGWNMYLNQCVKVDRGNLRSVRATMEESKQWLARSMPLFMFPEGTRSKTGEINEFHTGPFKLALECDCPVVPIVIDGTFPIYRGFQVLACPGTLTIRVLDPVTPADADGKTDRLRDLVHDRMKAELARMRGAERVAAA